MSILNYSICPICLVSVCLAILHLLSSSRINAASDQMHSASSTGSEGKALLIWKASLDNYSQSQLSSWLPSVNPCSTWIGVRCNKAGRVSVINITSSGIKGTLDHLNFSSLAHLTRFDLDRNALHGTIPANIGNLSRLIYLRLASNQFVVSENNFVGAMPRSMKNCSSLRVINVANNQLSGSISEEFGIHPDVEFINLRANSTLPPVGLMCHVYIRVISTFLENKFFGQLSWNWSGYLNLTALGISNNNLSGRIPSGLGELSRLQILYLSSNHLHGKIPRSLGKLTLLLSLKLHNNSLSGNIPSEIGQMFRLLNLTKMHSSKVFLLK
ncbi:unnamed protein product [Coffea canephora]|uniref:Leucine-rich repeat-containing N-terminal plant-type domain-containing protein n=1 Tax=Coffea canephora TaxID=49390 RepID=A0A068UTY1_COFCA|nr:unnamed protein product [Coffea canephora]